ncbi:SDR family NAD(P)-dependent oxidoreductase [Gordonia alkanivorans]|uniref:SDR family NAD(P)-dependent oxidoreductase n=1 Tax=Gordonia alkanivorans TaxID=84096 RepID=UPI00357101B0
MTGAGQGIGRQIAITLAGYGVNVVVNDFDIDRAAHVVDEISAAGGVRESRSQRTTVRARVESNDPSDRHWCGLGCGGGGTPKTNQCSSCSTVTTRKRVQRHSLKSVFRSGLATDATASINVVELLCPGVNDSRVLALHAPTT